MTKRQRKRRKSGQQAPARSSAQRSGAQQASLQNFTIKGWAVTAQVLRMRRDVAAVLDLMGFFDWLGDENMRAIRRRLPRLACESGCAYCCHVGATRPDLLPVEALRIVKYLEQDDDARRRVKARLETGDSGFPEDAVLPAPCLFLHQERCTIYPVRPLRCRAQNSPDAALCEQNYRGRRATMPLLSEPALLYKSLQMGLRLGLQEVELGSAPLQMTPAIRLARSASGIFDRWLGGEAVFEAVVYPEAADEAQLIARFMRQNRVRLGVEQQAMQRVISMCVNAPGTWARYTVDGRSRL